MKYISENGKIFDTPEECMKYELSAEFLEPRKIARVKEIETAIQVSLAQYDEAVKTFQAEFPEYFDDKAFVDLYETASGREKRTAAIGRAAELEIDLYYIACGIDDMVNEFIRDFPDEADFQQRYQNEIRPTLINTEVEEKVKQTLSSQNNYTR